MSQEHEDRAFWVGFALTIASSAIYAWERKSAPSFDLFPLIYHGCLMLLGLALMAPRFYRTTLATIRAVFGKGEK